MILGGLDMGTNEIVKTGIIGGIVIIIIELIIGFAVPSIVYSFSFIAMLIGGFIAGWMIKGKRDDALIAGGLAGLIYIIIGFIILYQSVFKHTGSAGGDVVGLIVGIILGAIGAFAGHYLAHNSSSHASRKKK